jgi:hypothetical protein
VGLALFGGHHEAVVRQRVALRIGQQKATIGSGVDDHDHRQTPAVWQRPRLLAILTTDIRPSDEGAAILANVGGRHRDLAPDLSIDADRVLIGPWCPYSVIELQVRLGSTTETRFV